MIREYCESDIDEINVLLKEFNFVLNEEVLSNKFLKVLVYIDETIKGVLVYDLIYERIEIEYIIVDKDYRNKGIATKLLKFMKSSNKVDNITLEVRESNISAISFYEKNGFKKVSIRKNYYEQENGILMIKKLGV